MPFWSSSSPTNLNLVGTLPSVGPGPNGRVGVPGRNAIAIDIGRRRLRAVLADCDRNRVTVRRSLVEPVPDDLDVADARAVGTWAGQQLAVEPVSAPVLVGHVPALGIERVVAREDRREYGHGPVVSGERKKRGDAVGPDNTVVIVILLNGGSHYTRDANAIAAHGHHH